jgi:hypothetical protein
MRLYLGDAGIDKKARFSNLSCRRTWVKVIEFANVMRQ